MSNNNSEKHKDARDRRSEVRSLTSLGRLSQTKKAIKRGERKSAKEWMSYT